MEQFGVPSDVVIILNRPQLAENTGMAMRAMVNTGAKKLRLVAPYHEWPSEKADLASAEKSQQLEVELFDTLQDAISDLQLTFATSARERNMIKQIYSPQSAIEKIISTNVPTGIVFGSEKSGLTNEEISLCNYAIEIPSVNFSSYNLAQAVLIICYQFMQTPHVRLKTGKTHLASQKNLDFFLANLEQKLDDRNHFPSQEKHVLMMQTLRNLFKRATPTQQEIQSMRGVIDTLANGHSCE